MHLRGGLPSLCFIFAAVLSFRLIAAAAAVDVEEACKGINERHEGISVDFCVNSLRASTKSTKPKDLATGATQAAINSIDSTEKKIQNLKNQEKDENKKNSYGGCIELYDDSKGRLTDAMTDISKDDYVKAMTHLRVSLYAADKCKEVFKDAEADCPNGAMDQQYSWLGKIAIGILLGSK